MHDGFKQLSDGNLLMTGKTVELALKDTSGKTTTVELSFSAFIEDGRWFGVSIVRDVSERKSQEKLLEESQQVLKALFAYNPEAIVFTDKTFHVTDVNSSFTELFGFSLENIKGQNIADVIVPEELKKESRTIEGLIKKGQVAFSTKRKSRDGTVIDVSLSGGPLVVKGKIIGFFMAFLDISNLTIVQNVLASALSKAELLNEKIVVLGGFTRHDVRNKLGLIQGNLYLARNKCKIEPNLEKYLGNIDDSIRNICDIFDFAKNYEMIGVEELVPVDIGNMVQNAVSLFSDLKGVKIENRCIGIEVIADCLLTQVFYNLIDNSLKYGGKIRTISIFVQKINEDSVKLFFKDDGVGVDKNSKAHIFERGFGKGTGFGLYLINKICEVYGWTVKEIGQPGQGAQFEFTIPVKKVERFVESR
jgi:PAS domain S-box-containing protein